MMGWLMEENKTQTYAIYKETHCRLKDTHRLKVKRWKKISREDGNGKKIWISNAYTRQNDFITKASTRHKEVPSNPTSGYLFEETQNTTLKGHVNSYVHCSIIYNNQDIEATWMSIHG